MLKRLCLENFKSFKRLELPEITTITLIGGQNNVGKTSVDNVIEQADNVTKNIDTCK